MNELNLKVTVPADLIGKLFQNGLASVIDSCIVSVMDAETKTEPKVEREELKVQRKLIKFVCPECGRFNYALVEKEGEVYKMTCRGCKEEFEFHEMDLVKGEYRCSNCERSNYYFTPYIEGMEVKTDECKCGHKTAMRFDHNSGIFTEV